MCARRQESHPLLVSFSGIDGAGKSTQIDCLREQLQNVGLRVSTLRFWEDAATLKSMRETAASKLFRGDRGVGTPHAPIERRDKNIRSPFMTCVRLCIYLMDVFSLNAALAKAKSGDVDVIIADRYILDELANLDLGNPLMRFYSKIVAGVA